LPVSRVNAITSCIGRPTSAPMISFTSPPLQKPRPSPVITIAFVSAFFCSSAKKSVSGAIERQRQCVELLGPRERDGGDAVGAIDPHLGRFMR